MTYNPYHSLSPAQDTATYRTNPFRYNLIPSEVINAVEINPDTNITTITNEDGSEQKYNAVDSPALILEFHDAVNEALDNKATIDAFIQASIDSGRLTAV